MTIIKAVCPICGDVDLTREDITLRLVPGGSTYTFTCPVNNHGVTKDAPWPVATLLINAGVYTIDLTALPAEALEPKAGPPIDLDYLIDFMRELEKL